MFTDPILNRLITLYPKPTYSDKSDQLFARLIEAIISQQLSIKAADTIFLRFRNLFLSQSFPTPKAVLGMSQETIRNAGLSFAKSSYIHSVASAFVTNQISIASLRNMPDEAVITELTKIKGVGKWTAEMILISTFNRPDVFSVGDLGLKKAIKNLYSLTQLPEILQLSQTWKPYRSTACWYLWRSLETY